MQVDWQENATKKTIDDYLGLAAIVETKFGEIVLPFTGDVDAEMSINVNSSGYIVKFQLETNKITADRIYIHSEEIVQRFVNSKKLPDVSFEPISYRQKKIGDDYVVSLFFFKLKFE